MAKMYYEERQRIEAEIGERVRQKRLEERFKIPERQNAMHEIVQGVRQQVFQEVFDNLMETYKGNSLPQRLDAVEERLTAIEMSLSRLERFLSHMFSDGVKLNNETLDILLDVVTAPSQHPTPAPKATAPVYIEDPKPKKRKRSSFRRVSPEEFEHRFVQVLLEAKRQGGRITLERLVELDEKMHPSDPIITHSRVSNNGGLRYLLDKFSYS